VVRILSMGRYYCYYCPFGWTQCIYPPHIHLTMPIRYAWDGGLGVDIVALAVTRAYSPSPNHWYPRINRSRQYHYVLFSLSEPWPIHTPTAEGNSLLHLEEYCCVHGLWCSASVLLYQIIRSSGRNANIYSPPPGRSNTTFHVICCYSLSEPHSVLACCEDLTNS